MAVLRLHYKNAINPEQTVKCSEFDIQNARRLGGQYGNQYSMQAVHKPTLQQPWLGVFITSDMIMRDEDEVTRFEIFNPEIGDDLCQSMNKDIVDIITVNNKPVVKIRDSYMTEVFPGYAGDISEAPVATRVLYEQFRVLFNSNKDIDLYTRYTISGSTQYGYQALNTGSTLPTSDIPAYYQCSVELSKRWISNDGLYQMSFGVRNGSYASDGYGWFFSGGAQSGGSEYTGDDYGLHVGSAFFVDSSFRHQWTSIVAANPDWMDTPSAVSFGGCKPVHFVMPAGTYTTGGGDVTLTEDKIMFGIAGWQHQSNGEYGKVCIQAVEQKCWKSEEHRITDMGEDTDPAGGNGPFTLGTDNPLGSIARAKKQGISTNPTQSGGFYVFKFTETEWENFTNTLTQVWNIGYDINNIKFVYRSPLNFTTAPYTLSGLWLGMNKVTGRNGAALPTMHVVQNTLVEGNASTTGSVVWPAETFLDLEPYASTSIQIPFCARVDVPPSLLHDKIINVKYSYELLTRAASATVVLSQSGGGTTHFSSFGECAAEQPTVLAKNAVGEVGKQLAPVITSGVATLATGGTVSPAALATATGAATGFAMNGVDFVKTNLPAGSSTGPYWDTVNGGQMQCSVLGVKTRRFTSGETVSSERAQIIGYKSEYYVDQIQSLGTNAYVEVEKINIPLNYMTKAEADKIVALLREGVLL